MANKNQNIGIYRALVAQFGKLARHNRQVSYHTKERYCETIERFCCFLANEYQLQGLANLSDKHLTAYALYLQRKGKSASSIKTDLAAIRCFHDKVTQARYQLPSNDELTVKLEHLRFGAIDRIWSNVEFNRFLAACMNDDREDCMAIACRS